VHNLRVGGGIDSDDKSLLISSENRRPRVLIVDDQQEVAELVGTMLEFSGYEVAGIFQSGEEAVAKTAEVKPDLVLMDVHLGGRIDGISAVRELREQLDVPVIYMTGLTDEETVERAHDTNPFGFLVKPFEAYELALNTELALARHRAEILLKESERKYRILFEESRDAIYMTSADGTFTDANPAFLDLFKCSRAELHSLNAKDNYASREDRRRFKEALKETGSVKDFGLQLRRAKDGTLMDCLVTVTERRSESGEIIGYQGIVRDVTELRRAEATIRHMAYHDTLTGLPNRMLFYDRLGMAVANAARKKEKVAVMMLDLDHFKEVNDTYGHAAGDQLLQAVAERLTGVLRKVDTVGRMGGDEFMLILPEITHEDDVHTVAQKIADSFHQTFAVDGRELWVTTSVGISLYPDDSGDIDALVKHADAAMYEAKRSGRNRFQRYMVQE
jgi:diguanylate cyclase (GGDEF)-like protein/PAS domain S-box-containing protein